MSTLTDPKIEEIRALIGKHKRWDQLFAGIGLLAMMVGVVTLIALFIDLLIDGSGRLTWQFFTSFPSRHADQAGILASWVGTILVMLVTALSGVPLGIAAGIYLEEYASRNWITDLIEINVTNLAGVPSIIYGLLALGLFVYQFDFGERVLTAGLTLGLLILPVVVVGHGGGVRSLPRRLRGGA